MKYNLLEKARVFCNMVVNDLKGYLLSDSVKEEMMTWSDSEAPEMVNHDLEATRKEGNILFSINFRTYIITSSYWHQHLSVVRRGASPVVRQTSCIRSLKN